MNINFTFSRWAGPLAGLLSGLIVGAVESFKSDVLGLMERMMLAGGVGLAGGFLVMLADPARPKEPNDKLSESHASPNLSGNVLCLLGLIFFFMPFFSVALSGLALACNWRARGWAFWLSWVGLLIGLVFTSLLIWHWTGVPRDGG